MPGDCTSCQTPLIPGAIYCHMCGRRINPSGAMPVAVRLLLAGGALLCIGAWIATLFDVESVLFTGPAILAVGIILTILSTALRFPLGGYIGAAHCAICILFTTLVNLLSWSPGDARVPFISMGAIYCALSVPLSIRAIARVTSAREANRCVTCGYLLKGLTEPRCPECGTAFDSALLTEPTSNNDAADPK